MAIGVSPLVTRSAAGNTPSTITGLVAREIAQIFVGAVFAHEFVKTHGPHDGDGAAAWVGKGQFAAEFGF